MPSDSIRDRIRKFIVEHFPLARAKAIGDDDQLLTNGIMDSLGVLELVTYLEAEFGVSITDDELLPDNFQTIESLTAFVHAKSQSQPGQLS